MIFSFSSTFHLCHSQQEVELKKEQAAAAKVTYAPQDSTEAPKGDAAKVKIGQGVSQICGATTALPTPWHKYVTLDRSYDKIAVGF